MTNEEAIEILQNKSCYECSFGCNSAITCECEKCDYRIASIVAIEALNTHDELCENLAWYINERQRLIKEKERAHGELVNVDDSPIGGFHDD